jgi:hypothetical protein
MLKSLIYLQLKIWFSFLIFQSDKRGVVHKSLSDRETADATQRHLKILCEGMQLKSNESAVITHSSLSRSSEKNNTSETQFLRIVIVSRRKIS